MNKYVISPSLMGMYDRYTSLETAEEREAQEREIIDYINKVPKPEPHLAARGTAFNNLMDKLVSGCSVSQDGEFFCEMYHDIAYNYGDLVDIEAIANYLGRHTLLDRCISQVYCSTHIDVEGSDVIIHGYADYVRTDFVLDLKTTSNYVPNKYANGWQHRIYPIALIDGKQMSNVSMFEYLVVEMSEKMPSANISNNTITGIYCESYRFDYDKALAEIRRSLSSGLLPFIEDHRHLITRKAIFQEV